MPARAAALRSGVRSGGMKTHDEVLKMLSSRMSAIEIVLADVRKNQEKFKDHKLDDDELRLALVISYRGSITALETALATLQGGYDAVK